MLSDIGQALFPLLAPFALLTRLTCLTDLIHYKLLPSVAMSQTFARLRMNRPLG
ncbi:hypothetical protein GAEGOMKH_00001 [Salmonella phage PRF-SP11]|nr:hypothetical protein GAEGOMKH_00001 [Salmonella phage PRF-SP11]